VEGNITTFHDFAILPLSVEYAVQTCIRDFLIVSELLMAFGYVCGPRFVCGSELWVLQLSDYDDILVVLLMQLAG